LKNPIIEKGENMVLCPKCGAENPKGSRYCGECGTYLVSVKKEKLKPRMPLGLSILAIIWLLIGGMWFVLSVIATPSLFFLMRANWKFNMAWGMVLLFMIIFGILTGVSLVVSSIGFWRGYSWSPKSFKTAFVLTISLLMTLAYDDIMDLGIKSDDIIMWVLYGVLFIGTFYVLGKKETRHYLSKSNRSQSRRVFTR
jgi:ribosomal protein L40E